MALTTAVLKTGTTLGTTGGTDVSFTPTGTVVPNGIELVDTVTADPRLRAKITASSRSAVYEQLSATWSKDKRDLRISIPKVLSDLSISFRVVRITIEEHPEATDAERATLLNYAAQVMFDADFVNFIKYGSLA